MAYFKIVWRTILALICVAIVLWLFDQNIPFAGTKRITYTFGSLHGSVSQLRPLSRASSLDLLKKERTQTVFEDPVYFDIKTPVPYQRVTFAVFYRNHSDRKIGMGVKDGEGWKFTVKPLKSAAAKAMADASAIAQEATADKGEWTVGEVAFDLSKNSYANRRYTFLFSLPGLTIDKRAEEYVVFSRMDVKLYRDNFLTTLKNLIYAK